MFPIGAFFLSSPFILPLRLFNSPFILPPRSFNSLRSASEDSITQSKPCGAVWERETGVRGSTFLMSIYAIRMAIKAVEQPSPSAIAE